MMRFFLPILLIGSAIGLFVVYTNKAYQADKVLAKEAAAYNDALDKAQDLKTRRDELLAKRNTFSTDAVQKLEHVLPDNVDNIRLIIDINNIAARHSLLLKNVQLGDISDGRDARNAAAIGASGDSVGSVQVSFSVSSNYDNFLAFLYDLEHSLRIVDIEKIDFSGVGASGNSDYTLTIRTYWLH